MGQSRRAARTSVFEDRTDVAGRVVAFLRGLYPQKWADCVAADLGVSVHTIRKLEERGSAPSLALFSRMVLAYGPAVMCAALPEVPEWLGDAERTARLSALEAEQARLQAKIDAVKQGRA